MLTKNEKIAELLQGSTRWGANEQPQLEQVLDVLDPIPIVAMEVNHDTLRIKTEKPLTPSQAYSLARLGQDIPEQISDNQTDFTLWWD